ncbi:MAG: hypothetical protein H0V62_08245 [Gammaproteobacteria bacterium]|nr:hypothetical protein [Gammaproteobacteria bacterium]
MDHLRQIASQIAAIEAERAVAMRARWLSDRHLGTSQARRNSNQASTSTTLRRMKPNSDALSPE